jgi:peptidoglycan/LPS O-acetylase OafA/YrhL
MDFRQGTGRKRIPALDALRGVFALLVVIDHTLMTTGAFALYGAAHFAVYFFSFCQGSFWPVPTMAVS